MPCHMSVLVSRDVNGGTHVLWSPLLVSHDNALDDLDAGETTLLPLSLQLLENDFVQLLVLAHLLEILSLDAILLCKVSLLKSACPIFARSDCQTRAHQGSSIDLLHKS